MYALENSLFPQLSTFNTSHCLITVCTRGQMNSGVFGLMFVYIA